MVLFRVEQLAKDEEEERRIKSLGASSSAPEHIEARQTTFQVSLYMLTGTILGTFELGARSPAQRNRGGMRCLGWLSPHVCTGVGVMSA